MTNNGNANRSVPSTSQGSRRGNNQSKQHADGSKNKKDPSKPTRWVQIRLLPIWLRIIIVLVLLVVAVYVGLTVGYGYMGEGDPADAIKWSTWQHLIDIMNGTE